MQGDAARRGAPRRLAGGANRAEGLPPCGSWEGCVCRRDDRVTVADMERMANALGMRLSDLVA